MKISLVYKIGLLIVLLNLCVILPSAFPADNAIIFNPPLEVAEAGDTVDIHIALDSAVTDVMMYLGHIKYDSSIVRLIDAYPDTAWSNLSLAGPDWFDLLYVKEIDGGTGDTTWYYRIFDIIWSEDPKVTINGFANIATLRFEMLNHGATFLYFDTTVVKNDFDSIVVPNTEDGLIYVCPLPVGFTFAGDADGNDELNVADLVYMVNYVFKGGAEPLPISLSGDANCDLVINVADLVYLVDYVFKGGPPPCNHCP